MGGPTSTLPGGHPPAQPLPLVTSQGVAVSRVTPFIRAANGWRLQLSTVAVSGDGGGGGGGGAHATQMNGALVGLLQAE